MNKTGNVVKKKMTQAKKDDLRDMQGTLDGFKKDMQEQKEKINKLEEIEEIADSIMIIFL